jgi:hypothetical protein
LISVDNLLVETVPDPSTTVLLAIGCVVWLALRRGGFRRRRNGDGFSRGATVDVLAVDLANVRPNSIL